MIISTLLGAYGSLYLKKGSKEVTKNLFSFINKNLIIGISLYLISTVAYIYLLGTYELSILYPLTSLTYIWVMILSKIYLNEKINNTKIISIILIIMGIIIIMI
jgi:drug/metabolite transporter (DMT)-like permease